MPTDNSVISMMSVVSQNPDSLSVDIGEDVAIMSIKTGLYGALDPIGSVIWKQLETPIAVADLIAQLCEEYKAPAEQIEKDVVHFLESLLAQDMILVSAQ